MGHWTPTGIEPQPTDYDDDDDDDDDLLTLENTNSYQILLFMFSFNNSLLPKSLENTTELDIKKSEIHPYNTRTSSYYRGHYGINCLIL